MRKVMLTLVVVGMLAPPSLGVINVKLTADGPTWNGNPAVMPGQTTTIRVWAQGTAAGILSLGGDIAASGSGLASSNAGSLVFTGEFSGMELPVVKGTPGANGGWVGFGARQAIWDTPNPDFGKADFIEVCHYTVTAGVPWTWGPVTLTFVARNVSGYKPLEVDKTGILGTIIPLTLTVIPEPGTLALLTLGGLILARRRA